MSAIDSMDPRTAARDAFARIATGNPTLTLERASMDAGFRSYWRGDDRGQTVIVMDSPPDKEDVRPWLAIRDVLEANHVRVPRVHARDVENGFLLLEDLGTKTLLQAIDELDPDAWFGRAIDQLLKIQATDSSVTLSAYDYELLTRELRLFDEWFIGTHLDHRMECDDMDRLEAAYSTLIQQILAQPQGFVHRDFMLRNLMPVGDELAVLDFQDAVHGPLAYDAMTLLKDAFISWPEDFVERQWRRYHERALAAGIAVPAEYADFRRDVDYIGIQRHLKVIGIFARLKHRDGKPKYLQDVPRFIAYLEQVLPRYPELQGLSDVLRDTVKPRLNA